MYDEKRAREYLERFDSLRPKDAFKRLDDKSNTANLILHMLCKAEGDVYAGDLSAKLFMSTPRVAAALRMLETRGFITRNAAVSDARKVVVSVTDEGRAESAAQEKEREKFTAYLIDEIGEDDFNELLRIVGKIHEAVERKKSGLR